MVSDSLSAGSLRANPTSRKDWDPLIDELYAAAIAGAAFGIGIATKQKGFLGTSMKLRLNQRFPSPQVTQYIRKRFQVAQLDKLFEGAPGLERDAAGVYKVVGADLGLPKNCLVYGFENPADKNLRGVILYGGERMEGHLERRLQAAGEVLQGAARSSPYGGVPLDNREQLLERLSKINVKRLFEYDMDLLARIVNGLEETKEELPKHLKPIFKSVSDYILKRRLKQGR
jgi:hypothetical protein